MRNLIAILVIAILTACGNTPQAADQIPQGVNETTVQQATTQKLQGVSLIIHGVGTETVNFPSYCYGAANYVKELGIWRVAVVSMEDLTGRQLIIFSNPAAAYEIVDMAWHE